MAYRRDVMNVTLLKSSGRVGAKVNQLQTSLSRQSRTALLHHMENRAVRVQLPAPAASVMEERCAPRTRREVTNSHALVAGEPGWCVDEAVYDHRLPTEWCPTYRSEGDGNNQNAALESGVRPTEASEACKRGRLPSTSLDHGPVWPDDFE